jgi:hypothetical protein
MFPLRMNKTRQINASVQKFKGKIRLDIREFYFNDEKDEFFPTKKGVPLELDDVNKLIEVLPLIQEAIKELS